MRGILVPVTNDYAHAFAAAVAREINAERGRQSLSSSRAFARRLGTTNHTSVTNKLSPDAARFVVMTVADLALFCAALGVKPSVILRRAEAEADWATLERTEVQELVDQGEARATREADLAQGDEPVSEPGHTA